MAKTGVVVQEAKIFALAKEINAVGGDEFTVYGLKYRNADDDHLFITIRIPRRFWRDKLITAALLDPGNLKKKNWVLEVSGREVLDRYRIFANKLAEKFGVHVHVKLVEENLVDRMNPIFND